ncbi:MAG TPA: acetylglutamate kinase [Fibrobacteria bacterium]|nr:acetylglutamate kinase [Fibrobacteria bacterium]HOX53030.1 acetylglutamate kinase [Fibrobacteria bacterium]
MTTLPVVVKIGGSMAEDRKCLEELAADLVASHATGAPVALVHGGGKDINRNLQWLGQEPRFVDGLRFTDDAAMDMVEMTLSGRVNKLLVRLVLQAKGRAAGISGVDGGMFSATPLREDGALGRVGSVTSCDPSLVRTLWAGGYLPVVSPVSLGPDGHSWNVNADDAAAALAKALGARSLVYISDVPGVLDERKERIASLIPSQIEDLIARGVAQGGMIPKLRGCAATVAAGVGTVMIAGWSGPGSLGRILAGTQGTLIRPAGTTTQERRS